jgi:histidinol phosphatase-like PHP family hydrolase
MKIDLHVHTSERSDCAKSTEHEQIQAAIKAGLDGIAITDHEKLVPAQRLDELRAQYAPFIIYTGIEVPANWLHWLVLGLHDPLLEGPNWNYQDLYAYVRSQGGLIILAHPYRYKPWLGVNIDHHTPDGIEVRSTNTPVSREKDIRSLAAKLDIVPVINSDSHSSGSVGTYYNEVNYPAQDDAGLISAFVEMKSIYRANNLNKRKS